MHDLGADDERGAERSEAGAHLFGRALVHGIPCRGFSCGFLMGYVTYTTKASPQAKRKEKRRS